MEYGTLDYKVEWEKIFRTRVYLTNNKYLTKYYLLGGKSFPHGVLYENLLMVIRISFVSVVKRTPSEVYI